jgi:pyruvate dehydrogenase E2 component (dihydrolipoamide acetyltransferase)
VSAAPVRKEAKEKPEVPAVERTIEPPVSPPRPAREATLRAEPEPESKRAPPAAESEAPAARPPLAHASPSVRRLARELGVDLARVPGTARKGRITKEDVQKFVKASLGQGGAPGVPLAGIAVAAPLDIDFSKWGATELQPLNRVRRTSAANLHRSWVTVPHVTQFDEADITELDAFRVAQKAEADRRGVKLTFLPFVVKAVTAALREFPHFNSSLDRTGESLIVKRYYHVGVAVDTENGLVVPVIRDADRKSLFELAAELEDLSTRARTRKLKPGELQGGSFSISSLGGIGGTLFTPIVNHPEVAILGVSRMQWKPVWQGSEFVPRLILPLSLSYDHRVIDGADAVRFTRRLAALVGDLRLLLL